MKNVIKKVYEFTKEIKNMTKWLLRLCFYHQKHFKINDIKEKVVVIGNGPSFNEFNLELAQKNNFEFLCVNFFALNEKTFFELKPKYYCIIDPLFYKNNKYEISSNFVKLDDIFSKVNWNMNLILLQHQKLTVSNNYIKEIYLNTYKYEGQWNFFKYWLFKNNLASFEFRNVINAALYFLITANASSIYMTGVDNDWHRELYVNEDCDVLRETIHFYGKELLNLTQIGQIERGELYKYFYWYYLTLYSYYEARQYAKKRKVPIYNCSLNSFIDVFPKKTFEIQVLGEGGK